jgi:uncharacterized membrane protein
MMNALLYTGAAVITRQGLNMGYPRLKLAIDFTGVAGIFYTLVLLYCQLGGDDTLYFTGEMLFFMILAGLFCFSAFLCQVFALESGKGAIVMAVVNTQSFF